MLTQSEFDAQGTVHMGPPLVDELELPDELEPFVAPPPLPEFPTPLDELEVAFISDEPPCPPPPPPGPDENVSGSLPQ